MNSINEGSGSTNSPVDVLVGFGSNQGDSLLIFEDTQRLIEALEGVELVAAGSPVKTKAITGKVGSLEEQRVYLNSVFRLNSKLDHQSLLNKMLEIEQQLGRIRDQRWGARPVDLDLLLVGDQIVETAGLSLPHPRMSFRRFVLEPAVGIAGDMVHPVSGCSLEALVSCLDRRGRKVMFLVDDDSKNDAPIDKMIEDTSSFFPNLAQKKVFFELKKYRCNHSESTIAVLSENQSSDTESNRHLPAEITSQWNELSLLIVISKLSAKDWSRVPDRFRGPTLMIDPDQQTLRQDIIGALEAM